MAAALAILVAGGSNGWVRVGAEEAGVAATAITYVPYAAIVARLQALAAAAPEYVQVWSAQARYGVASPGQCSRGTPQESSCEHWFVTLTEWRGSGADECGERGGAVGAPEACLASRPQVFLSGNLHGDEVVGPTTLLHLVEDLVAVRLAGTNPWVNRLFATRLLVAIPVTNPAGYDAGVREENRMDPNRDFPYAQAPVMCMRTTAARAVNEVWRDHIFRAAITFHGGMRAIAYEWGSPNHGGHDSESPDDAGQRAVGAVMREVAGALAGDKYPVDRLNKLVYPVAGGMEDWAYAGSWDKDATVTCTPDTYGGYPADRTRYSDASLRAFNILVETSDAKRPAEGSLGRHPLPPSPTGGAPALDDVLAVSGAGDGHVPRNMRLALAVLDLADPYLHVTHVTPVVVVVTPAPSPGARQLLASTRGARFRARDRSEARIMDAAEVAATFSVANDELQEVVATAAAGRAAQHAAWQAAGGSGSGGSARRMEEQPLPEGAYLGPGPCVSTAGAAAAGQNPCSAHAAAFSRWLQVEARDGATLLYDGKEHVAGSLRFAVRVGWDVGGAVTVDATSTLVGGWDPRIPPAFFSTTPVGDLRDARLTPDAVPAAAVAALRAAAPALSDAEATTAAAYIRGWQLVAAGKIAPADLPATYIARHAPPTTGVTRWVFGDLGTQPPPISTTTGAAAHRFSASSVAGAPDLVNAPFVTRFEDCFVVAPPDTADAAASRASLSLPAGCDASQQQAGGAGGGGRRAVVNGDTAAAGAPGVASATEAYIVLPYAVVDGAWQTQGSPEPVGMPPQSHMVNARRNPAWRYEHNGFVVQGRAATVAAPIFVGVETRSAAPSDAVLCELASTANRTHVVISGGTTTGVPPAGPTTASSDTLISGLNLQVGTVVQWAAGMTGVSLALAAVLGLVWYRARRTAAGAGWQRVGTHSGAPTVTAASAAADVAASAADADDAAL